METNRLNFPNQDCLTIYLGNLTRIYKLNTEGISRSKSQVQLKLLKGNNIDLALIQETHLQDENQTRSRTNNQQLRHHKPDLTLVTSNEYGQPIQESRNI